jgi:hypothetical protein
MRTVKGTIKDGTILLDEPLTGRDGEKVLVMFLAETETPLPSIEEVVAKIAAAGPSRATYIPPKAAPADQLARVLKEESIDSAAWDREWAEIEAEIKALDRADDEEEGRA